MPPQKPWTQEETDTLLAMKQDGRSYPEIGKALGRSEASVAGRVKTLETGGGNRWVWTPEIEDRLRYLWGTNLQTIEVARDIGIAKNNLLAKAKAMGLPPRAQMCVRSGSESCPRCHVLMEYVADCPVSKCPHFKGYADPYERTIAGVSAGWAANG